MELYYGPKWHHPYDNDYKEAWHWVKSLRHFFGCDLSEPLVNTTSISRRSDWDNTFGAVLAWQQKQTSQPQDEHLATIRGKPCACLKEDMVSPGQVLQLAKHLPDDAVHPT